MATRRTRSVFGQLKQALPPNTVAHFAPEFEWLGRITGPCRDLDVWIVDLARRRKDLSNEEKVALAPLQIAVYEARELAHAELVRDLTLARFQRLLEDLDQFLSDDPRSTDLPPEAETAVTIFADGRISKACRRVRKLGRSLGNLPEAAALHRLRIAAKKLRYLFEFFRSLDRNGTIDVRIKDLKTLQDVLGELNDLEYQRTHLSLFAKEMESSVDRETRAALERLGYDLDARREQLRSMIDQALPPVIGSPPPRLSHSS